MEYLSDLKNNCVAFVRQGALWEYQTSGNKMMEVFSFPQQSNSDARDTYMQNDIQIVNIDEAGNMYFLVSGYMNRGRHEGESGVAVYYFNATDSSITECLFVEAKQNYELLKRDVPPQNIFCNSSEHMQQEKTDYANLFAIGCIFLLLWSKRR